MSGFLEFRRGEYASKSAKASCSRSSHEYAPLAASKQGFPLGSTDRNLPSARHSLPGDTSRCPPCWSTTCLALSSSASRPRAPSGLGPTLGAPPGARAARSQRRRVTRRIGLGRNVRGLDNSRSGAATTRRPRRSTRAPARGAQQPLLDQGGGARYKRDGCTASGQDGERSLRVPP